MATPNGQSPAFPVGRDFDYSGLTIRDWFAGMALQGLLGRPVESLDDLPAHVRAKGYAKQADWQNHFATVAYGYADAMLKARQQKGQE